jgi:hypothetical protein
MATVTSLSGIEGQTIGEGMSAGGPYGTALEPFGNSGSAVVDWGDGSSDTCQFGVVPPPNAASWCYVQDYNEFDGYVYGWHTYAEQNPAYTITVYEYDSNNVLQSTDTGTADVADGSLSFKDTTATTLVGAAASTLVGHFTDADPGGNPSDYAATIYWGDGSPPDSNATITDSVNGGFDVEGTHAYANPSPPGGYAVSVTVTDEGDASTTIESTVNATLSGAVSPTLEEGVPFSGVIAQFCGTAQPVDSATVDWGDGTGPESGATIQQSSYMGSTCYDVSGSHTYGDEAAAADTLTVTPDPNSGASAVTGNATVADAPLSSKIDAGFLSANSLAIPSSVIAHVSDANTLAPMCNPGGACDLTAQITWGDSSAPQAGALQPDPNGGFDVLGGPHTYPAPGSYTVTVSVQDVGRASVVAHGTYTVTPPPQPRLSCQNPVPQVGSTAGLYGQRLPLGSQPNWGISPDDRVLRFGNLVLCAADAPWVYDGPSSSSRLRGLGFSLLSVFRLSADGRPHAVITSTVAGGTFETKGRVIVNGLELEPADGQLDPLTVDTSTAQISGSVEHVNLSQESFDAYPPQVGRLGTVDLGAIPWLLQGNTLGWIPNGDYADGYNLSGPLQVVVDGLGTVSVDGNAQMPNAFSLRAYSGGPATSAILFPDEYPGLLGGGPARDRRARVRPHSVLRPLAHVADGSCSYPPAPPNAPIDLHSDDLFLGGIDLHCAYLYDDPSTGTAEGGGGFGIGTAYVNGYFGFNHGNFDHAGGGADGLNIEIFPGVTLNSIHFGVFLNPSRFHATSTIQVGEGLVNLTGGTLTVFATGDHTYSYDQDQSITGQDDLPGTSSVIANPFASTTIGVGAEYQPLGLFDVHGYVLYEFPSYLEIGGHFGYDIGVVSADGGIQGQFWLPRDFDIEGNLSMCFAGFCSNARGLVSSIGLTGCWDVTIDYLFGSTTYSAGGAYRWGDSGPSVYIPPFSDSCDDHFGQYRVSGEADIAQAGGARTFHLGRGLHSVMVKVTGSGDAPAFAITGPHGETATTGDENKLTGGGAFGLFRSHVIDTTWVAILHPAGGPWTITPQAGSAPITSVSLADYVPGASVRAHVSGRGQHRVLHYSLMPRPGQVVRFVEQAPGVAHSIGKATARRGTIAFMPAIGRPGRRQIVAQVSRNGLLGAQFVVTTYVAPGPPKAAKPTHLRVARRGSRLSVSWGAAANATGGYQIVVIASDGRRLLFQRPSGGRSVTVPSFSASGATVTVEGVGPDGHTGRPATAHLKPVGPPARVRKLRISRRGSTGIRITWRPSAGTLAYRVLITLTGALRPVAVVTTRHALSFTVQSPRVGVSATVQGEGAIGILGGKTSARLGAARKSRRHGKHSRSSAPASTKKVG